MLVHFVADSHSTYVRLPIVDSRQLTIVDSSRLLVADQLRRRQQF